MLRNLKLEIGKLTFILLIIRCSLFDLSAQFWDTFESYSSQPEADAAWVSTNAANFSVDIVNDNIFFDAPRSGDQRHNIYFDLGTPVSNNSWVLRAQITITEQKDAQNINAVLLGLTDSPTATYAQEEDRIGVYFRSKVEGPPARYYAGVFSDDCAGVGPTCTGSLGGNTFNHQVTLETIWVEIIRVSPTVATVELFSDAFVTSIEPMVTLTIPATIQNLRFIKLQSYDSNGSSGNIILKGHVDDIQLCDGTTVFNCNPVPLPVELLSFSARWEDETYNAAIIEWQTTNEINNDYFLVERSIDAINFSPIMQVDGLNNAIQVANYRELDNDPFKEGTSYYRLKQVDYDGTFVYSQIEALNVPEGVSIINLFPNPVVDELTVLLTSSKSLEVTIDIKNNLGQLVRRVNQTVVKGLNSLNMQSDELSLGNYYIEITAADGSYQAERKFVKTDN